MAPAKEWASRPRSTSPRDLERSHSAIQHPADETEPLIKRQGSAPGLQPRQGRTRSTTHLEEYKSWRQAHWTVETSHGQAKWWVVVVSAFANMGPSGCLVVSTPQGGLVVSLVAMLIFMLLSLFAASLTTRALQMSGANTLSSCWRNSIGPRTAWIPAVAVMLTCFGCSLGFMVFTSHLVAIVLPFNPVPTLAANPQWFWMALIALFPMSFLVCMKDITIMKPFTAVTLVSCTVAFIAVVIRYFDGSYGDGGRFATVHHKHGTIWGNHSLPIREMSRQTVLFLCHFNTAKYFRELENPKTRRYTHATALAMGVTFVFCAGIMIFVFLTFGEDTAYITLDNYSRSDALMNVARIGLSIGLLGCHSLLFCGMREAAMETLNDFCPSFKELTRSVIFQNVFSVVMLYVSVAVCLGSMASQSFIFDAFRSCFGALLIYCLPPVLFMASTYKHLSKSSVSKSTGFGAAAMFVFGAVIFVGAAALQVLKVDAPLEGPSSRMR